MYRFVNSMFVFIVFLLLGLGMESCEKQVCEELLLNDLELHDLELYELIVLPFNPDSDDQISVIEKICGTPLLLRQSSLKQSVAVLFHILRPAQRFELFGGPPPQVK